MPDIPPGWTQVLAAAGAILVVIAILRWTGAILSGHGKISELLINRSYDLVDKMVPETEPSDAPSATSEYAAAPPPPPPPESSLIVP
jgi:hypothetical protein